MIQSRKFYNPVRKNVGNVGQAEIIEVGDTILFVLRDGTSADATVTAVSDDGRTVSWDGDESGAPPQEQVKAAANVHRYEAAGYENYHDGPEDWYQPDTVPHGNDPFLSHAPA